MNKSGLWALSAGKCPHMEQLNSTGNSSYFNQHNVDALGGGRGDTF